MYASICAHFAATFLITVHLQNPIGAAQQLIEHDTEVCHRNSSAVVKLMADFLGLEECKSKKGKPDASWSKITSLEANLAKVETGLAKLEATSQEKSESWEIDNHKQISALFEDANQEQILTLEVKLY